ncbi:hypothetical protein A5819_000081 [Enterococcus sp. 7E2_DIV0204]|uniref:ribonuclease domain-containing protein n=1 Tax=unclassified Enterococcus TaxID=2608891 RepID=UPI000A34AB60|nr:MULTISPECIES: ribonuclease domain-containing protein [unclassified Enterococcus]OTN87635.1 hypothetical protein A5819_000081 [Enterococcus sp. 7E2_DIV0204]OTP49685.1 hypothetical protein A5884_002885 [Enterococcus sp. 7D2_DIV0200]
MARSYTPRRNYVGVNYIRGRNGQPVGYQTYNQALYYQSAAYRYQVQVQRAQATRAMANVRIKKVCDTADKKWTGTKKSSMGAGALLGLPTLIGGGSTLTATEAASALFTGAFGGLLIGTGYLIGKGINQRAKDLRTDDGIDARNYGVNRLPKGWSSNDYNVSGQRGSLVVDNLGRRRISIDRTNGKTTYYSANGETLDSNSDNVPDKVRDVLDHIKKNKGTPPDGYKGGREYKNNPQPGKQKLPDGKYKEYDVDPKVKGQDRNAERLVVDEEGNAWYTDDHYDTFKKVK